MSANSARPSKSETKASISLRYALSQSARPSKSETKAQRLARAKAQAQREEIARREQRAKVTRRALLGAGLVAVAGGATAAVVIPRLKERQEASAVATAKAGGAGVPSVVLSDGSWTYGKDLTPGSTNDGAPVLDVYFDYSCHFCAAFEVLHSPEITKLLKQGAITLALHPCKILGMDWTDMVMNAMGLVLDKAPDKALDFHNSVFALFTKIYEAQDASMMTVDNVASTASEAGVPQEVVDAIADAVSANTYSAWTELGTQTFSDKGFQGTPTVLLDGEQLDLSKIATASGLTDQLSS